MLNIYIAEDEPLAFAKLKLFLQQTGEATLIRHFDNGVALLAALDTEAAPDLLFLDIQMPGMTGMEVLERLTGNFPIIITSAYEQYALPSFGFNVTDYLLKPYTPQRLAQALTKAKEQIRLHRLDQQQSTITVKCEGKTEVLPLQDIICIESLRDYVRINLDGNRPKLVLETLSSFEQMLPETDFVRVHRSYIINIHWIVSFDRQTVGLRNGLQVPIGKTYKEQFERITQDIF